jgi:hypothetical protein
MAVVSPFKKATRTSRPLRLLLWGPSGAGKTMTAVRLAHGLVDDPDGEKIVVLDTEHSSAELYSDRYPFQHANIPFHEKNPRATLEATRDLIKAAREAKFEVLVIDGLTPSWWALNELNDQTANQKFRSNTFMAWSETSPLHRAFVQDIVTYPGHVIATVRAKTLYAQSEGKGGKVQPQKIGLGPEQRQGIEYEFDMSGEISIEHVMNVSKDRTGQFQDRWVEKPGESFGRDIRLWLSGGNPNPTWEAPKPNSETPEPEPKAAPTAPKSASGASLLAKIRDAESRYGIAIEPLVRQWGAENGNATPVESWDEGWCKSAAGQVRKIVAANTPATSSPQTPPPPPADDDATPDDPSVANNAAPELKSLTPEQMAERLADSNASRDAATPEAAGGDTAETFAGYMHRVVKAANKDWVQHLKDRGMSPMVQTPYMNNDRFKSEVCSILAEKGLIDGKKAFRPDGTLNPTHSASILADGYTNGLHDAITTAGTEVLTLGRETAQAALPPMSDAEARAIYGPGADG